MTEPLGSQNFAKKIEVDVRRLEDSYSTSNQDREYVTPRMFDPIRDALDREPGQILKQWAFEDAPDLKLFQLKVCPRYVELKKQALKEAVCLSPLGKSAD